jgi:hypothetical protein
MEKLKKIKLNMSKPVILIACCLLSSALQAQTDSTGKANALLKIEQSLCDALPGDSSTWNRYLDPQWYAITEDGTGTNRKDFLNGFYPFSKGISGNIKVIHPTFIFRDGFAVVHYVADENEIVFDQQLHTTYAMMDIWYQKADSWKMISMQIFEIPQLPTARKPLAADLKQFTGTYELSENRIARIFLETDTLFIQKNDKTPEILLQEMGNIFFTSGNTRGRVLFAKDGTGKMIMIERRNGQDLVWKTKATNK